MRRGDTLLFTRLPGVTAAGCVGGRKEAQGPMAAMFDQLAGDTRCGQPTWELAESALARRALDAALEKAGLTDAQLDAVLAGDLQCQCTATSYAMRAVKAPSLGLYSACATMAQALGLAAALADGGYAQRSVALASSHFCAAERQFRTPLGYGGKRTPTAQWTVTGAGAVLVECSTPVEPAQGGQHLPSEEAEARPQAAAMALVQAATFGRVVDAGVTDITNMGAAMAPAAWDTIARFFKDTGCKPGDFDAVYTGDLGLVGSRLLAQLAAADGVPLGNHQDCGLMIYDREAQDVGAGGSGAGCSACVLAGHILPALAEGRMERVLLVSTGALMSTATTQQGQSIPCVAHLVELAAPKPAERRDRM